MQQIQSSKISWLNTTRRFFATHFPYLLIQAELAGVLLTTVTRGPGTRQRDNLHFTPALGTSAQRPRGYFRYCCFRQNKPHGQNYLHRGQERESYLISKGENETIQKTTLVTLPNREITLKQTSPRSPLPFSQHLLDVLFPTPE